MYRMLQKDQEEPQEPRQSGSFKALQDFIDGDGELSPFLPARRHDSDSGGSVGGVCLHSFGPGAVLLSPLSPLRSGTRPIVTKSVKAPSIKPAPPTGNLQKLPMCDKCGNGIV